MSRERVGPHPLFLLVVEPGGRKQEALDQRNEILRRAWEELEPELSEQGYELVEVEFDRQGGRRILRLYIDREGGVTLDDCAAVSQLVSPLLDLKRFIDGSYVLEISSPGIDRPVRKPEDFIRFVGERVKLKTYEPVNGRKRFRGIMKGFRDGLVQLDCEESAYEIHIDNLRKAHLDG